MSRILTTLAACLIALAPAAAAQGDPPADAAPVGSAAAGPATVHIGLYLLRIDALDLKAASASITFYVWMRWRGEVDGAAFEVVNGTLESKDSEYLREKDGVRYAYYRCRATVNLEVDFRGFPFDEHRLLLELEHTEADVTRVVYSVDAESMQFLDSPRFSGWVVGRPTYEVLRCVYRTNWGMIGVPADDTTETTRFRTTVRLQHQAGATFTKTFLPLFISMFITFLAFLIHSEELEARVGVGVAGIFGAVTSQAVVSDNLPEISYLTLSDKIHDASLFLVFTTLLASIYVGWLARQERVELAQRVNRIAGVCMTVGYAALVLGLILLR